MKEKVRDGADVISSGRVFQTQGLATVKALLPTVQRFCWTADMQ